MDESWNNGMLEYWNTGFFAHHPVSPLRRDLRFAPTSIGFPLKQDLMNSQKVVTPVKTGVQRDFNLLILLDTGCSLSRP